MSDNDASVTTTTNVSALDPNANLRMNAAAPEFQPGRISNVVIPVAPVRAADVGAVPPQVPGMDDGD